MAKYCHRVLAELAVEQRGVQYLVTEYWTMLGSTQHDMDCDAGYLRSEGRRIDTVLQPVQVTVTCGQGADSLDCAEINSGTLELYVGYMERHQLIASLIDCIENPGQWLMGMLP